MVTLKAISGWDWIGLDGMGWLSYTAVTPRASLWVKAASQGQWNFQMTTFTSVCDPPNLMPASNTSTTTQYSSFHCLILFTKLEWSG